MPSRMASWRRVCPFLVFLSACLFYSGLSTRNNRDQEPPSQHGRRPGAANFSGRASDVAPGGSEAAPRENVASERGTSQPRSHSGPSSASRQAPPPPAFFSGSTEAETSGSRRRSGGLFCVFNYVPLTDTLLYITRVKLGNQAAALSQRSGLLPRY